MSYEAVRKQDAAVYEAMMRELERQRDHIELIASENFVSPAVLEAMGSHLTNKYAEGYPAARYYGGCQYVDEVENLAIERAKALFGAEHANVQPHSGSQANMAVYFTILQPGDKVLGMDLSAGMIEIARMRNPEIRYEEADMTTYCPDARFDLVTCTGDALNHIGALSDIGKIFRNVYRYTAPGGYFIFDMLNEREVSSGEPFEMDFSETVRVWFQMTRPGPEQVNLRVRVFENGELRFEENIRETLHDPNVICDLLRCSGFEVEKCADRLLEDSNPGTTWFVVARKPR